ncbi:hypothetical protein QQA44_04625 [Sneathia vaginalis]|uniref:hypothetical protein n=1 Tax=Sneathia vaginalis TaxID=187101 RepID=UPI0025509BBA|nr:hypothetical protein [Sneathia vaginalis]MDK9582114.1 hypothetical protein [Sneathia vaginalis]
MTISILRIFLSPGLNFISNSSVIVAIYTTGSDISFRALYIEIACFVLPRINIVFCEISNFSSSKNSLNPSYIVFLGLISPFSKEI